MAQSHKNTIIIGIHSTGLVLVQKMFFRNTARRIHSLRETTDAHGSRARTELVLLGARGRGGERTGAFGLVRFYENIS